MTKTMWCGCGESIRVQGRMEGIPVYCPGCGARAGSPEFDAPATSRPPGPTSAAVVAAIVVLGLAYDVVAVAWTPFRGSPLALGGWWLAASFWPLAAAVATCRAGYGTRGQRLAASIAALALGVLVMVAAHDSEATVASLAGVNLFSASFGAFLGAFLEPGPHGRPTPSLR